MDEDREQNTQLDTNSSGVSATASSGAVTGPVTDPDLDSDTPQRSKGEALTRRIAAMERAIIDGLHGGSRGNYARRNGLDEADFEHDF